MAGDEILRSKSADRNSYNSGDWFNRIDWTLKSNNWGVGLPPAQGNEDDWSIIGPALADPNLKPNAKDIEGTFRHMLEMLVIRKTSGLFRLRTADEIKQGRELLQRGAEPDPGAHRRAHREHRKDSASRPPQAVVLVNATPQTQTFTDAAFKRQPLTAASRAGVLAGSGGAHVEVPERAPARSRFRARTTAVFVQPCIGSK